jgi:hypothetical protein
MVGRIGAHTKWANTADRTAATQPARRGFMARFERQVDPDNKLSAAERHRRAESAMRAYMGQLALKREQKRQASRTPAQPAPAAGADASDRASTDNEADVA